MKKILNVCLSAALATTVFGCGATPQMIGRVPIRLGPTQPLDRTPVNVERTVATGEAIYIYPSPMKTQMVPAFKVTEDFQPPKAGFTSFPVVQKGTTLICRYTTTGQKDYMNPDVYVCEKEFGDLGRPMNGSTPVRGEYYLIVSKEGSPVGTNIGSMGAYWSEPPQQKFEVLSDYRSLIISKNELRQELVYSGKSGSTIKVSYREFSGDMARPAFTQDLTYDLAESKEIAFRSIVIKVVEATGGKIKYKVVKE